MKDIRFNRFLYRDLVLIIGIAVVAYEQIRLLMLQGRLKKKCGCRFSMTKVQLSVVLLIPSVVCCLKNTIIRLSGLH